MYVCNAPCIASSCQEIVSAVSRTLLSQDWMVTSRGSWFTAFPPRYVAVDCCLFFSLWAVMSVRENLCEFSVHSFLKLRISYHVKASLHLLWGCLHNLLSQGILWGKLLSAVFWNGDLKHQGGRRNGSFLRMLIPCILSSYKEMFSLILEDLMGLMVYKLMMCVHVSSYLPKWHLRFHLHPLHHPYHA